MNPIMKHYWLLLFGILAINAMAQHPNVVVLLSDDQGWGDLSLHGNTNLATPNIDSLGRDGVMFDRFYVCPVCSPTRAEFLTGRYHARDGVRGVSTGQERLDPGVKTIADTFKAAGYATGAFGKWHNGSQWPYHPNASRALTSKTRTNNRCTVCCLTLRTRDRGNSSHCDSGTGSFF